MPHEITKSERRWILISGFAFLTSGAGLLVYVLLRVPLGVTVVCVFAFVAALVALRLYMMDAPRRASFVRQLCKGILIGLPATAAYDLSRFALVKLFALRFWPFEAFRFFGYAIAGEGISPRTAIVVGALYHLTNGIFFSVSYCLLLGGRRWFYGVLWALGLEVLMFSIYPTWLDLGAVMKEFTIVSVTGHLAYGAVLGMMARRWHCQEI